MQVICNYNSGQTFPARLLNLGYTTQSAFTVSVGKEYQVFAMALWRGVVLMLLADDSHFPNWFPIDLFSMSDSRLPENWSFLSAESNESGLQALWGYERLITDDSHYDGLLEREPEALRHFYAEEQLRFRHD